MDRIATTWMSPDRIGACVPTVDAQVMIPLENHVILKSDSHGIVSKFNVNPIYGGVPPKGDQSATVFVDKGGISYHDLMGGMLVSTRNAENNCRNMDHTIHHYWNSAAPDLDILIQNLHDKYELNTQCSVQVDKVIFLPGSNILNTVDHDKVHEILVDNPTAMVKPHPIQNQKGMDFLIERYPGRVIPKEESGLAYLYNATTVWSTFNSEISLLSAILQKPWGNVTLWRYVFGMPYSCIIRHFKYKDVPHNFQVMSSVIASPTSGLVFPWQTDWQQRIDLYFERIMSPRWIPGLLYPYDLPE